MGESGNGIQELPRRLKLLDKQLTGLLEYGQPMSLSELDGFLAGVLICPEEMTPGEWLPMVAGLDDDDEDGEEFGARLSECQAVGAARPFGHGAL